MSSDQGNGILSGDLLHSPRSDSPHLVTDSRIPRWIDWGQLLLVVLLSPLLVFPSIEWFAIVMVVPLFWIVQYAFWRKWVEPNPLNRLILPLLSMVGVSVWATFDVEFSLGKVSGTLLGVFVFLSLLQWLKTTRDFLILSCLYGVAGLAMAGFSLLITNWKTRIPGLADLKWLFPPRIDLPGLEGAFNPNAVGGTMLLFVPFLISLGVFFWGNKSQAELGRVDKRFSGGYRRLAGGGFLLLGCITLAVLILSQSRGAYVGFAVCCLLMSVSAFRWLRYVFGCAVLGSVLLVVLESSGRTDWVSIGQSSEAFDRTTGEIGMEGRFELWNRALYGIQDFPATGMGMNSFRRIVHLLYPLFLVPPEMDVASAHNQFLQTALDLGIPGLIAYAAIWFAVARLAWKVCRYGKIDLHRVAVLGIGLGLIAQFVHLTVDSIPLGAKVGIFWWVAVALAAGAYKVEFGFPEIGRWRSLEVLLTWILSSLISIAIVGHSPLVALLAAIAGAAYIAYLTTYRPGKTISVKGNSE